MNYDNDDAASMGSSIGSEVARMDEEDGRTVFVHVAYPESDFAQNSEPSHGRENEEETRPQISLYSSKHADDIGQYGPSLRTAQHIQGLLDRWETQAHKGMEHEVSMGGETDENIEPEAEQDLEQDLDAIFKDQGTNDVGGTHIWRLADDQLLEDLKGDGVEEVLLNEIIHSAVPAVEGDAMMVD